MSKTPPNSTIDSTITLRLQKIQKVLTKDFGKLTALLLTNPSDITYFSQFKFLTPWQREAFLVIKPEEATLWHASFSPVTRLRSLTYQPTSAIHKLHQALAQEVGSGQVQNLVLDTTRLFADEYQKLQKISGLKLQNLDRKLIWSQRSHKDQTEQALMTKAAWITRKVMQDVRSQLKSGMSERDVRKLIDQALDNEGGEQVAFPTIVAFGKHTALPHHQPTHTKLTDNTPVLIDMGAALGGYRADMTRSFWFGSQPHPTFVKIEQTVRRAADTALELLTKSVQNQQPITAAQLDQAARRIINQAGWGPNFVHTTGHGLGLDIHEEPSINRNNSQSLRNNMAITIEPGIYLEGLFGYRHENTFLIKDDEVVNLTNS